MTTTNDHGDNTVNRLVCTIGNSTLHKTLTLALRDMRTANGRDVDTGAGDGNPSWIGLSIGMSVIDTLAGENQGRVAETFKAVLTEHGVPEDDAAIIYALRNSLLHGYGLPKPEFLSHKKMVLVPEHSAYAVNTGDPAQVVVSVPVFCSHLVERIAFEAKDDWDESLIDTDYPYL